jgi:outer membrane protein assembly factor BamB
VIRGWILPALATLLLVAVGAAGAYAAARYEQSLDIVGSPTVEFVTVAEEDPLEEDDPGEPEEAEPEPVPADDPPDRPPLPGIAWPTYGFGNDRLRAVDFPHRPPFRQVWMFRGRQLLEFPPVIAYNRLYFANNNGTFFAVNAETGRRAWSYESGRCVAAAPAVSGQVVFQTFLNAPPCNRRPDPRLTGEVIAFAVGFGRIQWRARIGPTESSPAVAHGMVYVGDWHGRVLALDERTGEIRWTFRTGAEVKGGVAVAGRRLYVGSYDHHVYALDALTGRLLWRSPAQPRLGGLGTFYSTPAAAYGRVYIGSTDGRVYSYGATSGEIRWSHQTGGWVYASPAVWQQLVLIGSYSGWFYAFDAATGQVRWRFRANGPISGSATVVNGVVYFATLEERTYALDARTGRQLWTFPDGKYTPVVADTERLYVVGHARVYGMVPR